MNQAWELLFEGKINEAKQLVQAEFCLATCKDYSLLNLMGYIYLYEKKYEHCLEVLPTLSPLGYYRKGS